MLRKVRKVIPREACITLYNAVILTLYDIWDSCGKLNKAYLDKLQRRAARVIEGYKSTDQITVGNTFSWSSLESRRSYNICLLVHKCISNLAPPPPPPYLLNEFNFSSDIHKYNTRNKDLLRLPLARTSKYQSSFRVNAVKICNLLPSEFRHEKKFFKFKKALKTHFKSL